MRNRFVCGLAATALGFTLMAGCEKPAKETAAVQKPLVVAKGDAESGKAIFDRDCAQCHRLGSYQKEGEADLAKRGGKVSPAFVAHHRGISLSQADVDNLKAFIAAQ